MRCPSLRRAWRVGGGRRSRLRELAMSYLAHVTDLVASDEETFLNDDADGDEGQASQAVASEGARRD